MTAHKQTTDGTAYTTGYSYNLSGALIEETYPSGRGVKNTLDADGDLQQVESRRANDTFRNYVNSLTYTAAGAVSSLRLGNGKWESTQFNSHLQPIQIGLGSSARTLNLLKLNFDYGTNDNNGNVKSQQISVPEIGAGAAYTATHVYAYDALNRIKQATETIPNQTGWQQTFDYDRYGNRRFDAPNTTTLAPGCAEVGCNPQIDPATNKLIGYQFDSAGNTKKDANGQTFIYDSENKQVQVNNAGGTVGQYFYNGDGQRVKKVVPSTGETTIFVYDAGGKQIAEYSTIVATTEAKTTYLTNDHLGSPRITTDAFGQVISRRDFMPFGEEVTRANYGVDSIRQKFTGYERDIETGLDFAQARMYGGGHGRFSTPDPYNVILEKERGEDEDERADILIGFISNPQRWNMYVYVVNNPLAFTDPDGQKPRTMNVFLDARVLSKEGLEEWQNWAASAQGKNKGLKVNIYVMSKDTPGTVNAFLASLKAKDTATIFMGHSSSTPAGERVGISFATGDIGSSGAQRSKKVSNTADGVNIKNAVFAVFSCGFGKGFDNLTSSNGTAFVSIVQGQQPGAHSTTYGDATNAAAFGFAQSIATGSWTPLTVTDELNPAVARGNSGLRAFPHPQIPEVNAGDRVGYRILPPPRKK